MLRKILITILLILPIYGYGQNQIDSILFGKINHYRDSLGIQKLIWDDDVYKMAEHHTKYLMKRCAYVYKNGISDTKETPMPTITGPSHDEDIDMPDFIEINLAQDRFSNYTNKRRNSVSISENVCSGHTKEYNKNKPEIVANDVFISWLNSKYHKESMFNPKLTHAACCTLIEKDDMILYRKNKLNNFTKCTFKIFLFSSTIDFYNDI